MPSFFLVRKGLRAKTYFMTNSARRALLPYLFKMSFSVYGPLTLWDILRIDYCCKPHVKAFYIKHFAYRGQGLDFDQEERIKRTMQHRSKRGANGYKVANMSVDAKDELDEHFNDMLGQKERESSKRSPIYRTRDLDSFTKVILEYNVLAKTPGRKNTTSIDGSLDFTKGLSMEGILADGVKEVRRAFEVGLENYSVSPGLHLFECDLQEVAAESIEEEEEAVRS